MTHLERLFADNSLLQRVFDYIRRGKLSIVVTGQTGIGKTAVADAMYRDAEGDADYIEEIVSSADSVKFLETSKKKERMTLTTYHAQTAQALVQTLANAIVETSNKTQEVTAREEVAEAVDIDIHLSAKNGKRYVERVTEIRSNSSEEAPLCTDIIRYSPDLETCVPVGNWSEALQNRIKSSLDKSEKEEFDDFVSFYWGDS